MKTIKELENAVVGAYIEKLNKLGGMRMPDDPKATVDYIKKKYGNFYESLLVGATDFCLEGFYEPRTNTISASMLIKCFKAYLQTPEGKKHYKQTRSAYKDYTMTPQEMAEVNRKALFVVAENYYYSFYEGDVKVHFRSMEAIHSYAVSWLDSEFRDDMQAEIEIKMQKYMDRVKRHRLRENHDKGVLRNLGYKMLDDLNQYDLQKLVDVASVVEKRIQQGWKP